jgi:hypothetical protein
VIESWRRHSTSVRPHASLGYRPPAPELFVPAFAAWPAALTRPAPPARLPIVQRLTVHSHQTRTTQRGPITARCSFPREIVWLTLLYACSSRPRPAATPEPVQRQERS